MQVLVMKHAEEEGPGTLRPFLESCGVEVATLDLFAGVELPEGPKGAAAVVSMGGPMNVYEDDRYPFLREEIAFLCEALRLGVPVLGICLGAQLLARACGGKVRKALVDEIGFSRVRLTQEGRSDPLFAGLAGELDVFQWHGDTFDVPDRGVLLAEGELCRNQAFRCGRHAYGLQFHVEVTREMIARWFEGRPGCADMLETFRRMGERFRRAAKMIYLNLLRTIILARSQGVTSTTLAPVWGRRRARSAKG